MEQLKNKSIIKSSNRAKSVVDFFELDNNVITCYCYSPENETEENYNPIDVALNDFEMWLDSEGYLKGDYEELRHPDDPCQGQTIECNYSIHEFLHTDTHNWNISDLLTKLLNKN
jgi:hypothetical protein